MDERLPLSDEELERLSELLLEKLLKRVANQVSVELAPAAPVDKPRLRKTKIAIDPTAKPTPEDFAFAQKWLRTKAKRRA
jgi:hypothetical protein